MANSQVPAHRGGAAAGSGRVAAAPERAGTGPGAAGREPLHVVMAVDPGYAVPLAVALAGADAAGAHDAVTVHVLHRGFDDDTRRRIESPLRHLTLRWHPVADHEVAGAHHSQFLSSASLFRLLVGDLLPDLRRVLYLDADTLIVDRLAPLGNADLHGHVLGAVRDSANPWAAGVIGAPWRQLGLDPATPYLNSGVLVIDLDRWRAEDLGGRCLALLREHRPRWGDQDALNAVLAGRWQPLAPRWNVQTADLTGDGAGWAIAGAELAAAVADPAVVHFTGMDKPWHYGSRHPGTAQWLTHLDRTAWSGWRPAAAPVSRMDRIGRAVVRAARNRRAARTPAALPH